MSALGTMSRPGLPAFTYRISDCQPRAVIAPRDSIHEDRAEVSITMPVMSLIMATRNAAAFLGSALASVPADSSEFQFELLLADGGSQDGTLSIAASDSRVRVVSRADRGIYDGMNRAIEAARGEILLILNSDDLLLPASLIDAARALMESPNLDHISGGALFGRSPETATQRVQLQRLSPEGALFGVPVINARLFRTTLVRSVGPFRQELGLAADREWLLRLIRLLPRSASCPASFYFYRQHAASHTLAGGWSGRHRVHLAELQLAAACLAEGGRPPDERRLLRAGYTLARVKLGLTGGGSLAVDGPAVGFADLLRGVILARRWRGRLSGF